MNALGIAGFTSSNRWLWLPVLVLFVRVGVLAAEQQGMPIAEPLHTNQYGKSLEVLPTDYIEGAKVERIALYPRQNDATESTIERTGILVRYDEAVATVLMCHGFMCNKYDQAFLRRLFPRGRYNIMSFDFRAHGEKLDGQTCTFGRDEAQDVLAAARFIKHHKDLQGKPLFVYGFSMGAVAAIEAQAKDNSLFNAMVLDCPFDSSEHVIQRVIENIKFSICGYEFGMPCRSILKKYAFHPYVQSFVKSVLKTVANLDPRNVSTHLCPVKPVESIKTVSAPALFIHCKNDEKVPVEAVKSIYEGSASAYKVLWLTNGRQHFDSFFYNPEKYTDHVRSFLEDVVSGRIEGTQRQEIIEDCDDMTCKGRTV